MRAVMGSAAKQHAMRRARPESVELTLHCCRCCNDRVDRLEAMAVFVSVADLRGFAPAARKMGLSPSAVTRLVTALEDHLKTRLLQRTTRSVTLTDAGARYLERARRI